MPRRYSVFGLVCAATLAFDQLSKYWARHALAKGTQTWVANYWDMRLSFNPGSAFGMFQSIGGARVMLSIVGIVAFIAIVGILHRAKDTAVWLAVALALVGGGAIGNVIDRILMSQVTDFVVWKVGSHEWPAFNIADAALVVGVGLLFFDVGKDKEKKEKKSKKTAEAA